MNYCTATHPKQPNTSGHARGRKLHLMKDAKFTVCNMLVDLILKEDSGEWKHFNWNGRCKNCFKK